MRKTRKSNSKFKSKQLKQRQAMNEDYKKALSFIVVLVVIIGLLAALFYLNGKYVSKDLFQEPTTTTTTEPAFNSKEILIDNVFNIKDKEYLVLFYNTDDKVEKATFANSYSAYMSVSASEVPLYLADLGNGMNKKHYDKDGKENTKPTKASEIVITRPTLMIIKKGKVTSYITDTKDILAKLREDID